MNVDAEHDVKLTANFDVRRDGGLEVLYTVENPTQQDVFLFNGLWNLNEQSQFEPDKQGAYCYCGEEETLVLFVGIPPLPGSKTPFFQIVPHVTHLEAGKALKFKIDFAAPVSEHNPYFPETDDSQFQSVNLQKLELRLQYLIRTQKVQVQPSKVLPGLFELITPEALADVKTLSVATVAKLKVRQRTDTFERAL